MRGSRGLIALLQLRMLNQLMVIMGMFQALITITF